tara:strand:+ start:152 stop:1096 length:945 start_codon:yes stop_codon:yes gene_type:complete
MKKKILLITGHRKSGTTLLTSLFDKSSEFLVYPPDITLLYTFFPNYINKKISFAQKIKILKKIIKQSFEIRFKQTNYKSNITLLIKKIFKKINKKNIKNIFSIIKIILNEYSKDKNFKYLVIKETSQLVNYDLFLTNFKKIKIINIIRNPLDNFSSLKTGKKYYDNNGEDYLTLFLSFILRSTLDLKLAYKLEKKYPKKIMNVKYEDLVNDKIKILKKINKFLNSNIKSSEFLPSYFGNSFQGNSFKIKRFKKISNKRVNIFKNNLDKNEISFINLIFEEMFNKYKYQIPNSRLSDIKQLYYKINSKFFFKKKI